MLLPYTGFDFKQGFIAPPSIKSPTSYGFTVVVMVEVTVGSLYVQLVKVTVWL
jgi:hypothetical protein